MFCRRRLPTNKGSIISYFDYKYSRLLLIYFKLLFKINFTLQKSTYFKASCSPSQFNSIASWALSWQKVKQIYGRSSDRRVLGTLGNITLIIWVKRQKKDFSNLDFFAKHDLAEEVILIQLSVFSSVERWQPCRCTIGILSMVDFLQNKYNK